MIILLTGKKHTGKDTVAQYLIKGYENFSQISFAEPMRKFVKEIFNWNDDWIENHKEEIDPAWGISYRTVMQTLGTDYFQFYLSKVSKGYGEKTGRDIWVRVAYPKIKEKLINNENVVISDCRFLHEYKFLYNAFASKLCLIKLERNTQNSKDNHSSEQEVDLIPYNHIINNDGSVADLLNNVDTILEREGLIRNCKFRKIKSLFEEEY